MQLIHVLCGGSDVIRIVNENSCRHFCHTETKSGMFFQLCQSFPLYILFKNCSDSCSNGGARWPQAADVNEHKRHIPTTQNYRVGAPSCCWNAQGQYLPMKLTDSGMLHIIQDCVANVKNWRANHFLQLNFDKSLILIIGLQYTSEQVLPGLGILSWVIKPVAKNIQTQLIS